MGAQPNRAYRISFLKHLFNKLEATDSEITLSDDFHRERFWKSKVFPTHLPRAKLYGKRTAKLVQRMVPLIEMLWLIRIMKPDIGSPQDFQSCFFRTLYGNREEDLFSKPTCFPTLQQVTPEDSFKFVRNFHVISPP